MMHIVINYRGYGWYGSQQVGNHIEEYKIQCDGYATYSEAADIARQMGLGCIHKITQCPEIKPGVQVWHYGHLQ
jgi:hypothetical protein